jgi:hypothetical protein
MPVITFFSIKNYLDIHSWMVSSEVHLDWSYPGVVITTESKSVSLEWRGFETFHKTLFFPIRIHLEDSLMDG